MDSNAQKIAENNAKSFAEIANSEAGKTMTPEQILIAVLTIEP